MKFGRLASASGGNTPLHGAVDLGTGEKAAKGASVLVADMVFSVRHDKLGAFNDSVFFAACFGFAKRVPPVISIKEQGRKSCFEIWELL